MTLETSFLIMSSARFQPQIDDSDPEDDYLGSLLNRNSQESDDDFSSLSFSALSSAQKKLNEQDKNSRKASKRKQNKPSSPEEYRSGSESDGEFFENDNADGKKKPGNIQKRNKHAPTESSSKRPVSKIREIPGLKSQKDSTLYQDIRFDAAYGKADWNRIRKDYAFLDQYREQEINDMQRTLKDKKRMQGMSEQEAAELKLQMQSLKSRLDTLRNRDLADKIVSNHRKEQMQKLRSGEQVNPYYLKKSDKRKMIQKAKFESMRSGQREKVMERKRKRRLGKEFKQLEFRSQQ